MKYHKMGGRIAAVAVLALAATTMVGVSAATATTGALTATTWSVSNNQTGASAVTYTYEFTTATAGIIKSVTATVPDGTTLTSTALGAGTHYGLEAGTVSFKADEATDAVETLTYTVTTTTPETVAAGVPIYIEFTGLTNSSTARDASSTVTTLDNTATTPVPIDTATSPVVTFGAASTGVKVGVPRSLTFENDTPSFELKLDPAVAALSTVSKVVVLKVRTNAGQGYKLTAKNVALKTTGGTVHTIPNADATATTAQADDTFGFTAALTVKTTPTSTVSTTAFGGKYIGYGTTAAELMAAAGPTGDTADVLTMTNRVKISFATPAGTYTDTITYVATPTY